VCIASPSWYLPRKLIGTGLVRNGYAETGAEYLAFSHVFDGPLL